ncbi:MAG: hypothetical protein K2Q23_15970 [Bryobacteraceae bacterium]|nr:hypothetical protein [Bryobacteraceae bacterium]
MRLFLIAALLVQLPPPQSERPDPKDLRLPNGKLQSEEVLKEEHKRTLKDVDEITRLAAEIRAEMEKNEHHVLSLGLLKKFDEIERITKRARSRVRK